MDQPGPSQWEQLAQLRQMSSLTGHLHEAQVLQLRAWPMVLFMHARSCAAEVDPDLRVIRFKIKRRLFARRPKDVGKRRNLLARSVRDMLGSEWEIEIVERGRKVYGSAEDPGSRQPDHD